MQESEKVINDLVNMKEPRTFENTIKVLAKFESDISRKSTQLGFYSQVSTSKDIREASKEHEQKFGEFQT